MLFTLYRIQSKQQQNKITVVYSDMFRLKGVIFRNHICLQGNCAFWDPIMRSYLVNIYGSNIA